MSKERKEIKRRVHHTSRFTRWMFGCDKEGKPDRTLGRFESVLEAIMVSCAVLGAVVLAVFAVVRWSKVMGDRVLVPSATEGSLGLLAMFTAGVVSALIISMIVVPISVRSILHWWLRRRLARLTAHHPETLATRGIMRTMSALAWEVQYAKGESEVAQAKARFWEAHELAQVLGHEPQQIREYLQWFSPPHWLEIMRAQAAS